MKRCMLFLWLTIIVFSISSCQPKEENRKLILDNTIVKTDEAYDYLKMETDIKALEQRYPDKMEVFHIGESVEGRKLYGIKIGNGSQKLLITAAFHAREWMTSYLLMNLIELFLRYEKDGKKLEGYNLSQVLEETTFYFIPMLNPDGVDLVLNGVGMRDGEKLMEMNEGSDDFTRWKANIMGTDLNRQFNAHWEDTDSKEQPSFENYKGEHVLDQPESQAIAEFTLKINPDMAAAYHLSGSIIFWYYNQTGKQYKRDYKIAKKISRLTGYILVKEEESDNIAAGYKDWFVKKFERPGYTIEIGDKKYDSITVEDIDQFILENRQVLLYLAKMAGKLED